MIQRRRFALQLTPLLDLLLIVMFAQYMEAQKREEIREEGLTHQSERLELAEQENANLQEDLARIADQQQLLGELVTRLFEVSPEQMEAVLDPNRDPAVSAAELDQLRQEFETMAEQSPGRAIMHLLTYHEIRKWCDVWEIKVERDFFTLTSGEEVIRRRLPLTGADLSLNVDAVQDELFQAMMSLSSSEDLVVILLTFDRSSLINVETQIRDVMPDLIAQYRASVPGDKQVHYVDFGHGFE
jgi:hypothetical protein